MATQLISGVQYSGIWNLSSQANAQAAGTWPYPGAGKLYAWGANTYGQLGLGNTTAYSSPKQVGTLSNWLTLAAAAYCSYGIKADGTLWAWGYNNNGQLGLGNTTNYSSPKQVGALTNWLQIAAGYYNGAALAIKKDGTLWAWGRNQEGELGLGNIIYYSSPKQVGSLTNWAVVAIKAASVWAIKTDGTLWSWGKNSSGQLGLGNTTAYSSPKQVGALTNWLRLTSGGYQSGWSAAAIKTDGTLWMWGRGNFGILGLGNTTYYSSPKQVGALTNWAYVDHGRWHTIASKTDGTLWSWGRNESGQLGLNNTTYYSSPKQIGSNTNWLKPGGLGYDASFALKTDGTLWVWGQNNFGQLGLGTLTVYSSPKQVGSGTGWRQVCNGYGQTLAIST